MKRTEGDRGQFFRRQIVLHKPSTASSTRSAERLRWEDGDGRPALSDSELRVAELAAKGHTNREISGILYITVSTVEQHLTRVYRKLNVTRRRDLPHDLLADTAC